jgi:hypothetical protein
MQFSWVKGFGLGSALPNWLHFVIESGEAIGERGLWKFGVIERAREGERGGGGSEGGLGCPRGLKGLRKKSKTQSLRGEQR